MQTYSNQVWYHSIQAKILKFSVKLTSEQENTKLTVVSRVQGCSADTLDFLSWHCIEPLTPTGTVAYINSSRNISAASLL